MGGASSGILQLQTICIAMSSVRAIRISQDSPRQSNGIFWAKKMACKETASQEGVLQGRDNLELS